MTDNCIKDFPYLTYKGFTTCVDAFEQQFSHAISADGSKSLRIVGRGGRSQYIQITAVLYKHKGAIDASEPPEDLEDIDPAFEAHNQLPLQEDGRIDYHIVYSQGWRVPVLYMRAYASSSQSKSKVILDIGRIYSMVQDTELRGALEAVEFGGALGVQDHPVLGEPYIYLHPCHTATMLRAVGGAGGIGCREYLAAWLSLVGPAVGLTLPSVPLERQIQK
ncbi:hypothetical protein BX070DRAFT_231422 [Coemansia spiralis]|nr:hypothetical protein BX070DRAFT_231422 [Coemansia spiralis]